MNDSTHPVVGRVIDTEDAIPLEFWVAVAQGQFLQLDDVVALEKELPDGRQVKIFGLVKQIRAPDEGARFDSDVFSIRSGVLSAEVAQAAQTVATRFEPEIFVATLPGQILSQPELPILLVTQFPFPFRATRRSEVGQPPPGEAPGDGDEDPLAGLT